MEALQPIEHRNQRILTTAQIAGAYGTDVNHIHDNYRKNKDRYTEGKHYYCLQGADLKTVLALHPEIFRSQNVGKMRSLYLWTEKGALMHAKSLNTDKAWEAYETLVDEYYRLLRPVRQEPTHTLGDALRQRALANEDAVPDGFFSLVCELARDLYFWEKVLNESLDLPARPENSVGLCWANYRRKRGLAPSVRCKYWHICPDGRKVQAWVYPIDEIGIFRQWLREVYFPEKFPAYQRYRTKRIGAPVEQKKISAKSVQTQLLLARSGMTQLPLFSEATA